MKTKTKLLLFYIFTFGIGYLIAKKKSKQLLETKNTTLSTTVASDNKVEKVINYLGGTNNIISVTSTLNNVQVFLKDITLINKANFTEIKAKGSFINGNKITILFGDDSKSIAEQIQNKLSNSQH